MGLCTGRSVAVVVENRRKSRLGVGHKLEVPRASGR